MRRSIIRPHHLPLRLSGISALLKWVLLPRVDVDGIRRVRAEPQGKGDTVNSIVSLLFAKAQGLHKGLTEVIEVKTEVSPLRLC